MMADVATPEEVLDFCNRVRDAVGLGKIPCLAPGTRGDQSACLIARNLGVEAEIDSTGAGYPWYLTLDPETRVSEGLGLPIKYGRIMLPYRIGRAAEAFDLGAPEFADLVDNEA